MAFNFPNSPALNTLFQPPGGPSYIWNGTVWTATTGARSIISDTPPTGAQPGDLWWESDSGNLYVWYDDGDSQQWVQINTPSLNQPVTTADSYNRIVNGAMQHSQENGDNASTASVANGGYYCADQWSIAWNLSPGTANCLRQPSLSSIGTRFISLAIGTAKAVLAAGDYILFDQPIEGARIADFQWGTANAKQVVVRFWFNSTITGKFSFRIINGAINRSYVSQFDYTTANTWQIITAVVPGDTTGTWPTDTSVGMRFSITLGSGSTYTGVTGWQAGNIHVGPGQTNGAATAGAGFNLCNVGLYLDPNLTGRAPAFVTPDYASELLACQRYWQKGYTSFGGNTTSAVVYWGAGNMPVVPRTPATVTGVNNGNNGFPATSGTVSAIAGTTALAESRTANAAVNGGVYSSLVTVNARM
jgi:hypothetical protein